MYIIVSLTVFSYNYKGWTSVLFRVLIFIAHSIRLDVKSGSRMHLDQKL